jgi:hypothetical protein
MPKVFCRRCNNPNVVKITDILVPFTPTNTTWINPPEPYCHTKATLYQCEDCDAIFIIMDE